ncbi:MAG: hypothetical protein H6923_05630 [Alphaproteobacteria bacterium]|nr:hypothetical protein [Alphaproteobacteria bacterium]
MTAPRAAALALAGLFAACGIARAQDAGFLDGPWTATYEDARLGTVAGLVELRMSAEGGGGRATFVHPRTGAAYTLELSGTKVEPGRVTLTFQGQNPPSHAPAAGDAPPVPGATALAVPLGATLSASVDGARESRPVALEALPDYRPPTQISFAVPAEGPIEELSGAWSYEAREAYAMRLNRAGAFDAAASRVQGTERWARLPPTLRLVTTLGPETMASIRKPAEAPALEAAFGKGARGKIWLSMAGENLPFQPRRKVEILFEDPLVVPTGALRPTPNRYGGLDVEVVLKEGLSSEAKPLTLNAQPGVWLPDLPGTEPVLLRFMRRQTEQEFAPTDEVSPGEIAYLEAIYGEAPFADDQRALVKSGDAILTVPLRRVGEEGTVYRSSRMLILDPAVAEPAQDAIGGMGGEGLDGAPAVLVRAALGTRLEAVEKDAAGIDEPKPVARARVVAAPPSLWEAALAEARACRAAGKSETAQTNYILTNVFSKNGVRQSLEISLEAHAAAILLRNELADALDAYVAKLARGSPVDVTRPREEVAAQLKAWAMAEAKSAERIVADAWAGRHDGLFNFEVTGANGYPNAYKLNVALSEDTFIYYFGRDKRAFLDYARRVIAEAQGEMLDYSAKALQRARKPGPCEVKELLKLIGGSVRPIVERLKPKLVRPPKGDEPAFPALVPDTVARGHVASLSTLSNAIAAQEELSGLDTDVVTTALTIPLMGGTMLLREGARLGGAALNGLRAAEAGLTALDLYDVYNVAGDSLGWAQAVRDERFGLGISGVAGNDYLYKAQGERRAAFFKMALGGVLGAGPNAVLGGANRFRVEASDAAKAAAQVRAARDGMDALGAADRKIVDGLVAEARANLAKKGPDGISAADRQVLALADKAAADRARRAAEAPAPTGPAPETPPASASPEAPAPRPPDAADAPPARSAADEGLPPPSPAPPAPDAPRADETVRVEVDIPEANRTGIAPAESPPPLRAADAAEAPARSSGSLVGGVEGRPRADAPGGTAIADVDVPTNRPTGEFSPSRTDVDAARRPEVGRPAQPPAAEPRRSAPPEEDLARTRADEPAPPREGGEIGPRDPDRVDLADADATRIDWNRDRRLHRDQWQDLAGDPERLDFDETLPERGPVPPPDFGTAAGTPGGGGHRYTDADVAEVRSFLQSTGEAGGRNLDRATEFWRRTGMTPDEVKAGRAFMRDLDPRASGLDRAALERHLDRFLEVHERISDPARRQAAIARYLDAADAEATRRLADLDLDATRPTGRPDRPPADGAGGRGEPPSSPPPRAPGGEDGTVRLDPPDFGTTRPTPRAERPDATARLEEPGFDATRPTGGPPRAEADATLRFDEDDLPFPDLVASLQVRRGSDGAPLPDGLRPRVEVDATGDPFVRAESDPAGFLREAYGPAGERAARAWEMAAERLGGEARGLAGSFARGEARLGDWPVRSLDEAQMLDKLPTSLDPKLAARLPEDRQALLRLKQDMAARGERPPSDLDLLVGDADPALLARTREDIFRDTGVYVEFIDAPVPSASARARAEMPTSPPAGMRAGTASNPREASVPSASGPSGSGSAGRSDAVEIDLGSSSPPPARRAPSETNPAKDVADANARVAHLKENPIGGPNHKRPPYGNERWSVGPDGTTFTRDGETFTLGPPKNADPKDGSFADVYPLLKADGTPSGYVAKRYGRRLDKDGKPTLDTAKGEHWEMVDDIEHGAGLLAERGVNQLGLVHVRNEGGAPIVVQRELNGPLKPKDVELELLGRDAPRRADGRLERDYARAYLELMRDMARKGIFWEDCHLGNVFFQKVRKADGGTEIRAGVFDTDRMDDFWNPRFGRSAHYLKDERLPFRRRPPETPEEQLAYAADNHPFKRIWSYPPKKGVEDPETMALLMLENRGYMTFDPARGAFTGVRFDLDLVTEVFGSFDPRPGTAPGSWWAMPPRDRLPDGSFADPGYASPARGPQGTRKYRMEVPDLPSEDGTRPLPREGALPSPRVFAALATARAA